MSSTRLLILLLLLLLHLTTATTSKRNFYDILNIDKTATKREVKKAYRKMAVLLHPDKNDASEKEKYEALFVELAEAYSVLSDEETRVDYDNGKYDDKDFNSNFDDVFQKYGYDGVQDTPANWFALVLISSMLLGPLMYVGVQKVIGTKAENLSRSELLQSRGLVTKTKDELEKEETRKREKLKERQELESARSKRKEVQKAHRREQAEKVAKEKASVATANIQAHVPVVNIAPERTVVEIEIRPSSVPWDAEEKQKFAFACKKYGMGTGNRWGVIANYMGTRDKSGVTKYVKILKNREEAKRLETLQKSQEEAEAMKVEREKRKKVEKEMEKTEKFEKKEKKEKKETKEVEKKKEATWSAEEQTTFEEALRCVPRSLSKEERWSEIARRVGKSRSDCVKRFKELRAQLSSSQ